MNRFGARVLLLVLGLSALSARADYFDAIGGVPQWYDETAKTRLVSDWTREVPPGVDPAVWSRVQENEGIIDDATYYALKYQLLAASPEAPGGSGPAPAPGPGDSGPPGWEETSVGPPSPDPEVVSSRPNLPGPSSDPRVEPSPAVSSDSLGPSLPDLRVTSSENPPPLPAVTGTRSSYAPRAKIKQVLAEIEEDANDVHGGGGRPMKTLPPVQSWARPMSTEPAAKADPFAIWTDRKNDEIDQAIVGVQDPKASPSEAARRMSALIDIYESQGGDPRQIASVREVIQELKSETLRESLTIPLPQDAERSAALPSVLGPWMAAGGAPGSEAGAAGRGIASIMGELKNAVPGPADKNSVDKAAKGAVKPGLVGLPPKSGSRPELRKISSSLLRDLASTVRSQHLQRKGWLASRGSVALVSARRRVAAVSPVLSAAVFPGDPDDPSPLPLVLGLLSLSVSGLLAWRRAKKRAAYLAVKDAKKRAAYLAVKDAK